MKNWATYAKCNDVSGLLGDPSSPSREKTSALYYFFEGYEQSDVIPDGLDEVVLGYELDIKKIPNFVDDMCNQCPVRLQCLETAVDHSLTGAFGGMYLTRGKYDKDKNSHKTDDSAEQLWQAM